MRVARGDHGLRHVQRRDDETGAITIVFAMMATLLIIVAAMIVDLGLARDVRRQSQNASDAASLAAANVLYPTGNCKVAPVTTKPCINAAVAEAKAYAETNLPQVAGKWGTCTAPPTGYTAPDATNKCVAFDNVSTPTKILVRMPNSVVATAFGGVTDVHSIAISSAARTAITYQPGASCALCFLGDVDSKKFTVNVAGAGIAVAGYVDLHPGGVPWTAASIGYGGAGFSGPNATPAATTVPTFTDPWATKPGVPPTPTGTFKGVNANPCTSGPGIYGSYEFSSSCTLPQGLYTVVGDWTSKNITVTATAGVTLYFTCATVTQPTTPSVCTGSSPIKGSFDMKNGDFKIVSPSAPSATAGMGIVYDRLNDSVLSLQGNGVSNVEGAIYAPASNFEYNGGSDIVVKNGPVILKSMTGNGNTGIKITTGTAVTVTNGASIGTLDQ